MNLDANDLELLHRAQEQARIANAIIQFLSNYFRDKYHLTPENQITSDGTIITLTANNQNGKEVHVDLSDLQGSLALSGDTETG